VDPSSCGILQLRGLAGREPSDTDGAMMRVLRAMAAAVVTHSGLDAAAPRPHLAMGVPWLLPHVDAAATSGARHVC
jgi:hypothetical protein